MGLLGRMFSMGMKYAPAIGRGIGQISNGARKLGQVIDTGRKIGTIANQASGGRLTASPIGQKIDEVSQKVGLLTGKVSQTADHAGRVHNRFMSSLNPNNH